MMRSEQLLIRVPLDQMGFVVAIVEAYEGLATVTAPEGGRGLLAWDVPELRLPEALALLAELKTTARAILVEGPKAAQ